jgi:hypothetical protein
MSEQNQAPIVTAAVIALVLGALLFWGYGSGGPTGARTATFRHAHAKLADGNSCVFTADFELRSTWNQWTFARNRLDIRSALVSLVGSKSRYMVETPVEREALGSQMVDAVNRVAEREIAERVELPEFEFF